MKIRKTFFIALLVAVFLIGFILGRVTIVINESNSVDNVTISTKDESNQLTSEENNSTIETSTSKEEKITTVKKSNLTDGQRKLLIMLGINPDEFTVTPEIAACAEGKIGAQRVEEIKNGATPSFSEGASLVVCYK